MTISTELLESYLATHRDFRLGGRGICIDFWYMESLDMWSVSIPRAHFEMNHANLKLLGTNLYLIMDGIAVSSIDLNDFDKLSKVVE